MGYVSLPEVKNGFLVHGKKKVAGKGRNDSEGTQGPIPRHPGTIPPEVFPVLDRFVFGVQSY